MQETLQQKLEAMRSHFNSGATRSLEFRKMQLQKLRKHIRKISQIKNHHRKNQKLENLKSESGNRN